ncbi:MAG: hypothetical protein QNJ31_09025 [Candidatus Caenarcaniphilales bacterium]|nr:hypothetical protein [Candidatus Caenarcaniphilales bacterium]
MSAAVITNKYILGNQVQPIKIGDGRHKYADKLDKSLGFLPKEPRNYIGEVFLAGSFFGALQQSLQQILIDLLPKSLIGGAFRALPNPSNPAVGSEDYLDQAKPTLNHIFKKLFSGHYLFNLMVALDESVVELLEYLGVYFLPTLLATSFASRAFGKITGVDFEMLGHPTHKYMKALGKDVSIGSVREKRFKMNNRLLSKIALGKVMLYALSTVFCSAITFTIPSIRTLIIEKLLGISDYSKLLGYKQKLNKDQDFDPVQNAKNIIKNGLSIAFASIPIFLGATWLLNKHIQRPGFQKFFKKASMHFDLDENFGLSRTFVAPTIMITALGYIAGSRDSAERLETFNRAFLWAAPAVIFYKQVITSFFAGISSIFFGVKDIGKLYPQMLKKMKKGERDFLEWNLLKDFKFDPKTKQYSGMITELNGFKKLEANKKLGFLKTMRFINWWVPYLFALFVGAAVNLHNLQKIWELHQNDKKTPDEKTSHQNDDQYAFA